MPLEKYAQPLLLKIDPQTRKMQEIAA